MTKKLQGVLVCLAGLGLQVTSDHFTDKNYPALHKAKGDLFMIAGATLYGFSTLPTLTILVVEMLITCILFIVKQTPQKNSL